MSPSALLTLEQLKKISEDTMKTDKGAREVQEQVENGEDVLDPDNSGWVMTVVLNTILHIFQLEHLEAAARLLNACSICHSKADLFLGHKH